MNSYEANLGGDSKENFKCKIFPDIPEDVFDVLGLPTGYTYTEEEVQSAYKRLAKMCHPDLFYKESEDLRLEAQKWFVAITEAKNLLIFPGMDNKGATYFKFFPKFCIFNEIL